MIDIALRMLFGERTKFAMLVSGICFSTILMTQGLALFFGILSFSYATAENIRSPIWIVDPAVEQVGDNMPLRDTDIDRVRSVEGVSWAAPLFVGNAQARRLDAGTTKPVTLVGLDASTLAGAPRDMIAGSILDLQTPQSVVVDQQFLNLMSLNNAHRLSLGDAFEMNDRRAVIVGIVKVSQGMGGATYIFTTWDRAKEYVPSQRKMLTHVLAAPMPSHNIEDVLTAINIETGLQAVTESQFKRMSVRWMIFNSPIPFVVGLIVGIGFIVGIGISGQTFYTFVLDNTRHLGALKAMGASNQTIAGMILIQAAIVGFVGFGLGVGLMSGFFSLIPEGRAPLLLLPPIPIFVFLAVLFICMAAAILCVWRVARIEPAIVFRS